MYNEPVFQESEITVQIRVSWRDTIRVLTDNRAVIFSNGYNCFLFYAVEPGVDGSLRDYVIVRA